MGVGNIDEKRTMEKYIWDTGTVSSLNVSGPTRREREWSPPQQGVFQLYRQRRDVGKE